jgi:prolyl-tRNA synthetase
MINGRAHDLAAELKQAGLRVYVDDSEVHNPGFKYNYWELRGCPVRLEMGKKDLAKDEVKVCVRYNDEKFQAPMNGLVAGMVEQMEKIQTGMYNKAKQSREDHISHPKNWEDFMVALSKRDICLAPWCDTVECETVVKDRSKEESTAAMAAANEGE